MTTYSFDTSAFIEGLRHYPFDVAESLWDHLDKLGQTGTVVAQQEVLEEIVKKHDGLSEWLKKRRHFFREPTDEVQICVRRILKTHPRLLSLAKNRSGADVWVIAQAQISQGAVVTYETWDPKRKNIKIPEVCSDLGVRCLTFVEFLRDRGIQLRVANK